MTQAAFRARGREVAEERLLRARSLLHAVTPDERAAIEEAAYAIASKVAECLLEEAARCPIVAAALTAEARSQRATDAAFARQTRRRV